MSGWEILSWLAWVGCGVFATLLAIDFVRVERGGKEPDDKSQLGT